MDGLIIGWYMKLHSEAKTIPAGDTSERGMLQTPSSLGMHINIHWCYMNVD